MRAAIIGLLVVILIIIMMWGTDWGRQRYEPRPPAMGDQRR